MGCCTITTKKPDGSTTTRTFSADNAEQCQRGVYNHYTDTASFSPAACSTCAFGSRLANYLNNTFGTNDLAIFSTWGTFDTLYDFRDQVLEETETGRYILALYNAHAENAGKILDRDSKLLFEALQVFVLGSVFARRMMAVPPGTTTESWTLNPEVVDRAVALIHRVRERAEGHALDEPFTVAERLLKEVRGATVPKVWEVLRRRPPTGSESKKA